MGRSVNIGDVFKFRGDNEGVFAVDPGPIETARVRVVRRTVSARLRNMSVV